MWVELRVHGVSGTPPESLLDFDRVRQVAGDEDARSFRRFDEQGSELLDDDPGAAPHRVEAFHWGRFTSGSWTQAFWLLLAPFGIVNAAQFMLPAPLTATGRVLHAVAGAMLRMIGLALTLLIVLVGAVIVLDLLAWQRFGVAPPAAAATGPAFAWAAAVGLVVVALVLLALSGLTRSPRAADPAPLSGRPLRRDPDGPPSDLVRPDFFEGSTDAAPQRRLHQAAGLAVLAVLGAAAASEVPGAGIVGAVAAGVLALAVLVVLVSGDPGRSASVEWEAGRLNRMRDAVHDALDQVSWLVLGLSALAFGAAVVSAALTGDRRPSDDPESHFPMLDEVSNWVVYAGIGALLVLALATALLARGRDRTVPAPFAPYARGGAAVLAASLGLFLGVGFTGAFTVLASNALNALGRTFRLDAPPGTYAGQVPDVLARAVRTQVHAPELLSRIVYAWGVTALVVVVMTAVALAGRAARRDRARQRVRDDYQALLPPRWVNRVAAALWVARLKNVVAPVLLTFFVAGLVLSAATVLERAGIPVPVPLAWLSASEADPWALSGPLLWLGSAVLALLAAALVTVGRSALLGESTRRGASVIWDVVAFWPRSVHPYVPPAYSQWAVPDLTRRIRYLVARSGEPGRGVVVCGHSQGSLIAVAALLRLAREDGPAVLDGLGLLTFGSQLQVMFSRGFPSYVDPGTLTWLQDRLGGAWRNLYRETDHLAGPVLSWEHGTGPIRTARVLPAGEQVAAAAPAALPRGDRLRRYGPDWCLPDPPIPDPPAAVPPRALPFQDSPLLGLRRHGSYWRDPAWHRALGEIRATAPRGTGERAVSRA